MRWLMRRCTKCSRYTLKTMCPACGSSTRVPHPASFSPDDKYADLRIRGLESSATIEASTG